MHQRLDLKKVKVTPAERRQLEQVLSNWDNLHAALSASIEQGKTGAADVLKMLKVEASSRKRLLICTRLLAVYHRLLRQENEKRLSAALAR